jgi:nucleotide-binding universal stress UspA family protein
MLYKDMLIAIDADRVDEELIELASQLARSFESELIVVIGAVATPTALPISGFGAGGGILIDSVVTTDDQSEASKRATEAREKVEAILAAGKMAAKVHVTSGGLANIADFVVRIARSCDLFVTFNQLKDDSVVFDRSIFESVLRQGACGAFVAPRGYDLKGATKRMIIAWNSSPEAARAVRVAIPFLVKASRVTVLLVDPELRQAGVEWRPGDELVEHLARYGVKTELARVASADIGVAAAIDAELEHRDARMVVMGGYGQSAIKDWVLGSVAREFLETANIPILMAN